MMKIGIPRALLYHVYEDLWLNFFKNLNIETVLSPETNKAIVKKGITHSIDESCYSFKVFMGHVEYLLDKCDMIFVPRIENSGIREEYCTRLFGVYDLVRNTFPNAKLLNADVNYLYRRKEPDAFAQIGETLGKSREESLEAYKKALATAKAIKEEKILRQEALLNSDDPKVLIVSHAYNSLDASIGKDITDFFAENKFEVAYTNIVDSRAARGEARRIYGSRIYWKLSAETVGGIELCKDRVDGIVLISTFPCGPDSIFNELAIRTIKDKPILSLVIDEQDAGAGLQTRLESFVDIIAAKRKGAANYGA